MHGGAMIDEDQLVKMEAAKALLPPPGDEVSAELIKAVREARLMVAQMVDAYHRSEWEEGANEEETMHHAIDCLANWGIDPGQASHEAARRALGLRIKTSL